MTITAYKKMINRALKASGRDTKALELQVGTLASALRTLDLADREIDGLESTVVWEETRYGKKMAPHPVFKVHKDAADSVTRQMKSLGLTASQLTMTTDRDPLTDLTREVRDADRTDDTPIRPLP